MAGNSQVREWANSHPKPIIAAAAAVILGGLVYLFYPSRAQSVAPVPNVYYYDLASKKLFVATGTELPPIDAPSGKDLGVAALVYGCNDCAEPHRFIAYLLRYTPAMRQAQIADWADQKKFGAPTLKNLPNLSDGAEVRGADDAQWVPFNSDAGQKLTGADLAAHCPGGKLIPCLPGN